MRLSKAGWVCIAWILSALLFNLGVYFCEGSQKALEFFTAYFIEFSLSIDNLFVFYLIFLHFKTSITDQNKLLSWGILGAQAMRAFFILAGLSLLKHYSWVVYVFGLIIIISGVKVFLKNDSSIDPKENVLLGFIKRVIPDRLPLFIVVLLTVEAADLIFAVDSIPAVLAVTKDPFIVYASNIFAILGLRAMYFVLSPFVDSFHYLHYTLGIILVFVGIKMLVDPFYHIPIGFVLGFIATILLVSTSIGLIYKRRA